MRIGHAIESLRGLRLLWVWLSPVLRRLFRLLPLVSQPAFGQQVGKAVQKGLEPFWGVAQGFLMGLLRHDQGLRDWGSRQREDWRHTNQLQNAQRKRRASKLIRLRMPRMQDADR